MERPTLLSDNRRVTGRWEPYGCPCPGCGKCGCGIENCVNRLGPEPEKLVCQCEWVPVGELPAGQCFQTKAGRIAVVWRQRSALLEIRHVIVTGGFDSEYGGSRCVKPDEFVKPMTYSVPNEEDYRAQDARERLGGKGN